MAVYSYKWTDTTNSYRLSPCSFYVCDTEAERPPSHPGSICFTKDSCKLWTGLNDTWNEIQGETGAHAHLVSDITGLQALLNAKALAIHTHSISDTTNLQNSLDGKADSSHEHVIADVTNLQTTLNGKAATIHTHVVGDITNFAHSHTAGDLPVSSTTAQGIVELATSAETTAGLAVQANDTRLSDARTPITHDIISAHNGFPGGTSTYLRADGVFAAPTATAGDLDKPGTGSFTVETAKYHVTGVRQRISGAQRATLSGTSRWRLQN